MCIFRKEYIKSHTPDGTHLSVGSRGAEAVASRENSREARKRHMLLPTAREGISPTVS